MGALFPCSIRSSSSISAGTVSFDKQNCPYARSLQRRTNVATRQRDFTSKQKVDGAELDLGSHSWLVGNRAKRFDKEDPLSSLGLLSAKDLRILRLSGRREQEKGGTVGTVVLVERNDSGLLWAGGWGW